MLLEFKAQKGHPPYFMVCVTTDDFQFQQRKEIK